MADDTTTGRHSGWELLAWLNLVCYEPDMNASSVENFSIDAPPALDNAGRPQRFSGGADFDVIILGAGASGLFCAREAARRHLRVLLLEGGEQAGLKLCLSGGGRANFTNLDVAPRHYRCSRPRFCQPALKGFTPRRILDLVVGEWRLPYEERDHGQLFLTVPARRLRDALQEDCRAAGCRLVCHAPVSRAWREGDSFCVAAGDGLWKARGLVVALGSPAWPQAGASDAALRLARSFGHEIVPPRPALAPLRMPAGWPSAGADCAALTGISSTAGILYFNDTVTYPDNTSEPTNLRVLPLPKPAGTQGIMPVTGVGLSAYRTTEQKAEAASVFLHWFTEKQRNLEFVVETGYMPVNNGAFEAIEEYSFSSESYRDLYVAIKTMQETYTPLILSTQGTFYDKEKTLSGELRQMQYSWQQRALQGESVDSLAEESWDLFCAVQ